MKEQRWQGDDQTIRQEFRSSRMEEDMGMADFNESFANDFLAMGMTRRFDHDELGELEPSWATKLDTVGMQPHSREYLERDATNQRSQRKLSMINGQMVEHCDGIQFSGRP